MLGSYLRNDIRTDMKTMAQNLAHEDCKLHKTQLLVGVNFRYRYLDNALYFDFFYLECFITAQKGSNPDKSCRYENIVLKKH